MARDHRPGIPVHGDERYADRVSHVLEEWLDANPRGIGINWASSLELALRAIAWTWTLALLRPSRALQHRVFARARAALRDHAGTSRSISRDTSLQTRISPVRRSVCSTSAFISGIPGGCTVARARLADTGRTARTANARGWRVFRAGDLLPAIHDRVLSASADPVRPSRITLPDVVERRVIRMCEFLRAVCDDNGSMLAIGDGDNRWTAPLARQDDDCRGVLSVAATVLRRPDLACDSPNDRAPETAWLVGSDAGQARQATRRPRASSLFPAGGYAIMRSGQGPDSLQLIFDVGPLGCNVSGAHGHADLLSVQCSAFGRALVTDAGTYCYTTEPAWRNYFRGSAAHSTVPIDDVGQAIPSRPIFMALTSGVQTAELASDSGVRLRRRRA